MADSLFRRDLEKYFSEKNLYKIFKLDSKCSNNEIKKAYKKMSLLHHPDRNDSSLKEESTKKFQLISKVHYILSDSERRSIYDESGIIDEEWSDDIDDWKSYWRGLYPKVTAKDISQFANKYKSSLEEKNDLQKLYLEFKGDMDKIMENLILSTVSEESRYREIIDNLIKTDVVPSFESYVNEAPKKVAKRKKMEEKENKEFSEGKDNMLDLLSAIQSNKNKRESGLDSFIGKLEEKYGTKSNLKKRKKK